FNASALKWSWERGVKMSYGGGPIFMLLEPLAGGEEVYDVSNEFGPSSAEFQTAFNNWTANSNALVVLDTYTLQINFGYAYAGFIPAVTYRVGAAMSPSVVLAHAANDTVPAGGDWTEHYGLNFGEDVGTYMFDHTCGTGPYMVEEWRPTEYVKMVLYEDYWRADATEAGIAPPSYAGSIKTAYYRLNEDPTGQILNMRTGLVDRIAWPAPNRDEIWDNVTEGSSDPDNIYVSTGGFSFSVTFMTFVYGTIEYTSAGTTKNVTSPFGWRDLRKACAYAFDYDAMIQAAYRGWASQAKGIFPKGLFGHNGTYYTESLDLDTAVAYWNDAMADSAFVDAINALDGEINIYYNTGNTAREQSCLILKDGFDAILAHDDADTTGLSPIPEMIVNGVEWPAYLGGIVNREYLLYTIGWLPDYADPDNYAFPFAISTGLFPHYSGYNDTEVDAWVTAGKQETDPDTRQYYYNLIQERMAYDQPYLFLIQAMEFRTWRTWLHGQGLVYNAMQSGSYIYDLYKDYEAYDAGEAYSMT
ncbi:MAG: ABC transporter substrate-binding protein, partial [Promethearchaeota archaeon]